MNVVTPLVWASAYNQVLWRFLHSSRVLRAIALARIRRKEMDCARMGGVSRGLRSAGSHRDVPGARVAPRALHESETNPQHAATIHSSGRLHLHSLLRDSPQRWPLCARDRSPIPQRHLWNYVIWTIGPSRLGEYVIHGRLPGIVATTLIGAGVAVFAIWKLRQRGPHSRLLLRMVPGDSRARPAASGSFGRSLPDHPDAWIRLAIPAGRL